MLCSGLYTRGIQGFCGLTDAGYDSFIYLVPTNEIKNEFMVCLSKRKLHRTSIMISMRERPRRPIK